MENTVYNGKFIKVTEFKHENHIWEKAYFPDSLVVIAVTDDQEIIFIEERRPHEENPVRLKMVTGHIDPGESALETANRELQEEAGFRAQKLTEILVNRSSGTINSNFHFILATGLEESKLPNPDGEDSIVSVKKIKMERVREMLRSGELSWNLSTLGLFKVLDFYKI
jgi:8-oxo-dGTP pyrophosphatase MutT (NUDIX family)